MPYRDAQKEKENGRERSRAYRLRRASASIPETDPDEEWRDVPSLDGRYQVSSWGRVRRMFSSRGRRLGDTLACHSDRKGYIRVHLRPMRSGPVLSTGVHRLVCEAFHGPSPTNAYQVNHKDGVRNHNEPSNLEWVTNRENSLHAVSIGLVVGKRGESNPHARLTAAGVQEIRAAIKAGESKAALARRYGVSYGAIYGIATGTTWQALEPVESEVE